MSGLESSRLNGTERDYRLSFELILELNSQNTWEEKLLLRSLDFSERHSFCWSFFLLLGGGGFRLSRIYLWGLGGL